MQGKWIAGAGWGQGQCTVRGKKCSSWTVDSYSAGLQSYSPLSRGGGEFTIFFVIDGYLILSRAIFELNSHHHQPTQLGPIDRASPYLRTPVLPDDGNRIQSPKRCVLKYKQDDIFDKDKTMDNVQERNKKKLSDFSPLANYTDRAIAAGQRS
jgi:hypothetical protein